MRVIATKVGFFGQLRQEGDEFDVPDGTKGSWFKPVEKPKGRPKVLEQPPAEDSAEGLT